MEEYKFNNAKQDDLWRRLTNQSHIDGTLNPMLTVGQIMDTWTLKKGYPVVTLERDYNNNKVKLSQKWFLLNPEKQSLENTEKWYIPFTHATQRDTIDDFIFEATPFWLTPSNDGGKLRINILFCFNLYIFF